MNNSDFEKVLNKLKNYSSVKFKEGLSGGDNVHFRNKILSSFLIVDVSEKKVYLHNDEYNHIRLDLTNAQKVEFFKVYDIIYNAEKLKFIQSNL